VSATHRPPLRIPRVAAALRLPLWQRGQARMRERWGFDFNAPDAVERVRALLGAKPDDPELILLLGSVLAVRGSNEDAEREVRRAVELRPEHARAHTTLATLLVQRGENAEGLSEARRAAELDGEDPTVQYNLGLAEWSAGDRRAASVAFDKAWKSLYGEVHPGARPPWWRRVFRRGTVGAAPPSAGGAQEDTAGNLGGNP
jgi:cytochrome c-type biogenesis protein CcmH/NrfG